VGLKKGHVVTKREKVAKPGAGKGKLGKRVKAVRELIREVTGFAPYEKRVMELLKVGKDKVRRLLSRFRPHLAYPPGRSAR